LVKHVAKPVILVLAWTLGLPATADGGQPATKPSALLMVMPVFGVAPPELQVPGPRLMAESLLLELPAGVEVITEEPAGRPVPEDLEGLVRARAAERGAAVVVWGELRPPSFCAAARTVRIRILDTGTGTILDRDLCPAGTTSDNLSRAIAVATVHALRSGLVESLGFIKDRESVSRMAAGIPTRAERRRRCPPPRKCKPCPRPAPCPPCRCPSQTPCPEPGRSRWFLAAGPLVTSHPRWSALGVGAALELSWSPWSWFETGLGILTTRGRLINGRELRALYTSWPVLLWARLRLGCARLEGTLDLGATVAWTRLEALLERFAQVRAFDRINPAVFSRLGLRWWIDGGFGLHALLGGTLYLRRQQYTYGVLGQADGVLTMQLASMETMLLLSVAID